MASFNILGRKELSVLLYFVILFCCCHVSCVPVNVTRSEQDIFSFSGISSMQCYEFCQEKHFYQNSYLTRQGICICQCSNNSRTFVTAKSKCVADKDVRNAGKCGTLISYYEEFILNEF